MEYISKKFTLDKNNRIQIRLDEPMELPGNEWYCGLKEFSLEQKWSLANEKIGILYQNGYLASIKPEDYHATTDLDKIITEMFPPVRRAKRKAEEEPYDVVGRITGNQRDSEDEEEGSKPKAVISATKTSPVKETKVDGKIDKIIETTQPIANASSTGKPATGQAAPTNDVKSLAVESSTTTKADVAPVNDTQQPATASPIGKPETGQVAPTKEVNVLVPESSTTTKADVAPISGTAQTKQSKTTQAEISQTVSKPETKETKPETKTTQAETNQLKTTDPKTAEVKAETKTTPFNNSKTVKTEEAVPAKKPKIVVENYETSFRKEDPKDVKEKWITKTGHFPGLRYEKIMGETSSETEELPQKGTAEKFVWDSDSDDDEDEEDKVINTTGIINPPDDDDEEVEHPSFPEPPKQEVVIPQRNPVPIAPNTDILEKAAENLAKQKAKTTQPPPPKEKEIPHPSFPESDDSEAEEGEIDKEEVEHPSFPNPPDDDTKVEDTIPHPSFPESDDSEPEDVTDVPHPSFPDAYDGDTESETDIPHPSFPDDFDTNEVVEEKKKNAVQIPTTTVTLPTDEIGKTGNKQYTVPEKLLDAIHFATLTTANANQFTKAGYESVKFTKNASGKYMVTFDPTYVRAIVLTDGFAQALGYTDTILINEEAATNETSTDSPSSHLSVYVNNILRPINYYYGPNYISNKGAEVGIIPIPRQGKFVYGFFSNPVYFKLETQRFDILSLEFKDFNGKPLLADEASGHIVLQFVKQKHSTH